MSDQSYATSGEEEASEASLELSGRQQALYEALSDQSGDLAAMYRGAIQVLEAPSIVNRFAMAAHNLREVMDKLPRYVEVPEKDGFNLKEAVFGLEDQLEDVRENSDCYNGEEWDGEIGIILTEFLENAESVFAKNRKYNSRRREKYGEMLDRLDPSTTQVSQEKRRRLFREWKRIKGFFLGVCHHGKKTDIDEFAEYLEQLERHMLARLRPRTFETQDTLDQIISEAESNG